MIVGLFFAMLGDIVLELNFIIGAILFALGHIWYIIAYSCLLKFKPTDLIAGFSIFIPSILLITLAPIFNFDGILMKIVCIIYALIISLMVGKSIHNLINQKNVLNVILVIGSILFFISDFMLLLSRFAGLHVLSYVCINTYYPAQALLSSSIKYSKINK